MSFIVLPKENRENWLQARQKGIGSSDAPVIMGVSRFKTVDQLLEEKAASAALEDKRNEYIKDRGNRIEQVVRKLYENEMGLEFPPLSCASLKYPFMLATLDGIDPGNNLLIEIKLLSSQKSEEVNVTAPGFVKWEMVKYSGVIPEDYYPQLQHQLAVTRLPACVFIGLREIRGKEITMDDLAIVSVLPDRKYIKELIVKEKKFWENVLKRREELSKIALGNNYRSKI